MGGNRDPGIVAFWSLHLPQKNLVYSLPKDNLSLLQDFPIKQSVEYS